MRCITWCGTLRGCFAVKFDSCNNLLSSVHTKLVARDNKTGFFGKPVFGCWKLVLNRFSVLLTFIKIYYYIRQVSVGAYPCESIYLFNCSTPLLVGIDQRDRCVGINSTVWFSLCLRESVYLSEFCPRPQQVRIDQSGRCRGINSSKFSLLFQ